MGPTSGNDRLVWIGLGALLLIAILLGLRTERGMRLAMATRPVAPAVSDAEVQGVRALLTELEAKDAQVRKEATSPRDPFRDPPPPPAPALAERPATRPAPPPANRETPALGALLYDEVNPSVQLRVGTQTSDWLHEGESFQDWTVVQIRPGAVTVSQNGDKVVLRPS